MLSAFRQGLFSKAIAATTLSFFAWTFCLSQPAYADRRSGQQHLEC